MPYSSISEIPSEIRGRYTSKQLRAFRKAFNSAVSEGRSEAQAFKIAHRAAQRAGERDAPANAKAAKRNRESADELAQRAVARVRDSRYVPTFEPSQTDVQMPSKRARAFLTEANGRTILTAPALPRLEELEKAHAGHPAFMYLQGKFVGAERANRNGAFWTAADLQMGEPTVKHGPLNWLHEDRKIVGTLAEAAFVHPEREAAAAEEPYIAAAAVLWRFLWPEEAQVVEMAAEQHRLWFSMECVSREVACIDHQCGSWSYLDVLRQKAEVCEHVANKTGTRRFIDPIFTGGACIVPPVRPGWPEAHAEIMRQAASHAERAYEQAGCPDVASGEWERLMAEVLRYAGVST